jgi:hypothetical protein
MEGFSAEKWGRRLLAALAALIPAIPIVAGLLISSGGPARASGGAAYVPSALQTPPPLLQPTPPNLSGMPPGRGAVVALIQHRTAMRARPGGRRLATLPVHSEFGSPEALWVAAHRGRWLGVVSPLAGNGRLGWIDRAAASLGRLPWELKVSLSRRRLTVLNQGKVLKQYAVAIGAPSAPTPTGRFAVTDRLDTNDPGGPYGCCILALSALSPHAIQGWSGGNRIAIHSTPDTASIGQAASHGCLRLTLAEGRWLLAHIPLGTPTLIST